MPDVESLTTAQVPQDVLAGVRALLDQSFNGDFSDADWEHTLGGWHVLVRDRRAVVAHAAVVPRTLEVGGRPFRAGYVEGVATANDRQGEGLGSLAMAELMAILRREFQLGALSTDRHAFYQRLGWQRWLGPTFVRDGPTLVRTVDEDDGVMVLRFGDSLHIDLHAPIVCQARPGDDW